MRGETDAPRLVVRFDEQRKKLTDAGLTPLLDRVPEELDAWQFPQVRQGLMQARDGVALARQALLGLLVAALVLAAILVFAGRDAREKMRYPGAGLLLGGILLFVASTLAAGQLSRIPAAYQAIAVPIATAVFSSMNLVAAVYAVLGAVLVAVSFLWAAQSGKKPAAR